MNGLNSTYLSDRVDRHDALEEAGKRLRGRLGLNVPHEWWPRAADLKAIEAAGFGWIQVASPPVETLADPRHVARHAQALRRSLDVTTLRVVVHGPAPLRLGSPLHNRAFEGLLEYAHQLAVPGSNGPCYVVYHGLDIPPHDTAASHEEHALRSVVRWAETLGVVICVENLCPVYRGSPKLSHDPMAVCDLVARCDSPAVRMLLDVGHAHVTSELENEQLARTVQPTLEHVALFHLHDNLGARRHDDHSDVYDPLRLDLHLPPGAGSLPWTTLSRALVGHAAPLVLEVHPPHRPTAVSLRERAESVLLGSAVAANQPELLPI